MTQQHYGLVVKGLENRRLRVHYLRPGDRKKREIIGICLGGSPDGKSLDLNMRPLAGTTTIPLSWITAIWETKDPIKLPEPIAEGEARLF